MAFGQYNARRLPQTKGHHTRTEWQAKFQKCGAKCYYCKAPLTFDIAQKDHQIPLCREGSDSIDNIVPSCRPCNQMKAWRTEREFVREYKRLSARISTKSTSVCALNKSNPRGTPCIAMEEQFNEPGLLKKVLLERERGVSWFWRNPA
jgi:5-methylcytosine-specific restriction endonuclease McrA